MTGPSLKIPDADQRIILDLTRLQAPELEALFYEVKEMTVYFGFDILNNDKFDGKLSNGVPKKRALQVLRESIYSAIANDIDIETLKNQIFHNISEKDQSIDRDSFNYLFDVANAKFGKSGNAYKLMRNSGRRMGIFTASVSEKPIFDDDSVELLGYFMQYNFEFKGSELGHRDNYSIELDYSDLMFIKEEVDLLIEKHKLLKSRYKSSKIGYFSLFSEEQDDQE